MRRPTLDDVARAAGFSKSAVSLALRNSPKLPETSRARIRKAARELGYRSDPMLAALAAHRWRLRPASSGSTLAALADGTLEGGNGMAERAATYGYRFEVFQIGDYPNPKRLAQVLYSRGVLGLVVGQLFTPGFCAAFDWSRFVIVACCEGYERPPVHLIMPNHFRAVQEGWDHAWAAGYRRIGLALINQPEAIDYHDRIAAYLERQQTTAPKDRIPAFGLNVLPRSPGNPPADPELYHANYEANRLAMDRWLREYRPDVVLGFSNFFLTMIQTAGWRVPEQVAFISLWKFELNNTIPGLCLTTDEVGRRAVDWLDSLLRAGERGLPEHPVTMSVDLRWEDAAPPTSNTQRPTPNAQRKAGKPYLRR